jgi:hypothetical protein
MPFSKPAQQGMEVKLTGDSSIVVIKRTLAGFYCFSCNDPPADSNLMVSIRVNREAATEKILR